jgi:thiamine pyrophosphate-dependent acetolactate synthase large subunit-like protein
MSNEHILRYTDLAAVIQMARARGWSTARIVREMSSGLPYADAVKLAHKAAPLLDISVSEFMRLRKIG